MNKTKIRDKLIEFSKHIPKEIKKRDAIGQIKDPNKNPLEFVFGVILNQGIPYEKAWLAPFELKKDLDISIYIKLQE